MKTIDAWLLVSEKTYLRKKKNGYIDELISKANNKYHLNLEVKITDKFKIVSFKNNQLYYDNKKVCILPKVAIVRRYEIYLTRQLELMGVLVLNNAVSMATSRNKMKVHQLLAKNNIATPKTIFTIFNEEYNNIKYKDMVNILNDEKMVVKGIYGSEGKDVFLIDNEENFNKIIKKYKGRVLVQEYIKESYGCDIRAYVINGKFIGAALRKSDGTTFKSNLAQGGSAQKIEYNSQIIDIASKTAKAVGLDICGVDILLGKDKYYVCEVNSIPGFKSINKVANIDDKDIILKLITDKINNLKL